MRRVVSVWFPTLPIDRLRQLKEGQAAIHHPDTPLVTVTSRVVMAVDAAAAALGLRPGMKLAQAQALVPGLKVFDADPLGDAALLRRLAEWCLQVLASYGGQSARRIMDRHHRLRTSAWWRNAAAT